MGDREATGLNPRSTHVSDPFLRPFLQSSFDPAEYLNSTLPSLALSSQHSPGKHIPRPPEVSLSDLSSQTQSLLSQLNAQASRLTTILNQLTDDILRSGGRLAYEVEVLRGEAVALSDTLNHGIRDEIALLGGTSAPVDPSPASKDRSSTLSLSAGATQSTDVAKQGQEPSFMIQLRMLTHVRRRLDSVVKVFGAAMKWTLPPSEISITSSFISVSGPEAGSDSHNREVEGREFAESLRKEITEFILGSESTESGYEGASQRIRALNDLAQVWKGTAEEKARVRFVEGLAKLAEDRLRELERELNGTRIRDARIASPKKVTSSRPAESEKASDFLDTLYQMRTLSLD